MLENIKHSIVLLQIAKNTANPINGIYQGPGPSKDLLSDDELSPPGIHPIKSGIELGSECIENRRRLHSIPCKFFFFVVLNIQIIV